MEKQLTYNYSSTEIVERCKHIIELVKRDMEQFKKYGIVQKDIDNMNKHISDYESFPDDKTYSVKVSERTKVKGESEKNLRTEIRNFMVRISVVVQTKEEMKKHFRSQKVTGLTPAELIELGEKTYKIAQTLKPKLVQQGLAEEDYDNYKLKIKNLKTAVKDLEQVKSERIKMTQRRRELGRILYESLVRLSSVGKNIWKTTDIEKYKEYLLYKDYYQKIKDKRDEMLRELGDKAID